MVSQALVNQKTWYGLGKAASALGAACNWYRPNGANGPTSAINQLGTIQAYFRPASGAFTTPIQYSKAQFIGTFDATDVQVFDYIVEPVQGTFYVASIDPVTFPLCVRCNHTLTFARPGAAAPGADYYGGDVTASETPLMASWPASVLIKTYSGAVSEAKLPGDMRLGPYEVMLPAGAPGIELVNGDMVYDEDGNIYTVSLSELTPLGWRLIMYTARP
jgi:hypothetical protein